MRRQMAELAICVRRCVFTGSTITKHREVDITEDLLRRYDELFTWDDKCTTCGDTLLPEQRSRLRVGVRDIRAGDFFTRQKISENRASMYNCPSSFLFCRSWKEADGPLFFHFAQLYHRDCKHFRAKATASTRHQRFIHLSSRIKSKHRRG